MLKEVFECKTYTKYYRPPLASDGTLVIHEASATAPLDGAWPDAYARMSASKETCLVKTHDVPEDEGRAVYVVRNGFAASHSYQCYLRDVNHKRFSLAEVILGKPKFGSWGYHLDAWQPFERPNTLLLSYEDLVQKPEEQIAKLSEFCGLRRQNEWKNEFDNLHNQNPSFFRKGKAGDSSGEFSAMERDLFLSLHGDWMQRLGYAPDGFDGNRGLSELRRVLRASSPAKRGNSVTKKSPLRRAIAGIFGTRAGVT